MTVNRTTARHDGWRRTLARVAPLALVAGGLAGLPAGPAQAAEPVDGAQTSGDTIFPGVGNGGYDAQHYDLDLRWSPTGGVAGTDGGVFDEADLRMVAKTTGAALRSFSMDFEGLSVDSVLVDGDPADFTRVADPSPTTPKHKLVVTPDSPVTGEFTVEVAYHGLPVTHIDADESWEGWVGTADGATFLGQPIGAMTAYPHNNTPGDKASYTIDVNVPNTLTNAAGEGAAAAASNGELLAKVPTDAGTRTTWKWRQREQMASELVVISIGKYDVQTSQVQLSDGRTIPEWSFVDSSLSEAAKTTFTTRRAAIPTITRNLESIFGPYPGNSTGAIVDVVPPGINYALETQDRSFFPSVGSFNGNTLIHELAHQWYGDSVSPGLWTDIWINEGMASWSPTWHNQVLASATPNPAAVETNYFNSWNNKAADHADWATPPGAQTDPANLYGYQTYTRGAQFWEALRTALRDADFFEVVEQWQARYAGTSPRGDRLRELAEEISGRDLGAFWQDWIYDADKPAWPEKLDLTLSSVPASGEVEPGDTVTYQLSAANVGKVALAGGRAEVDLADVLADASLAALPAGLTLAGTTLTWAIPQTAVATTATTSFDVVIADDASSGTLRARAAAASLGGLCADCDTDLSVVAQTLTPVPTISGKARYGATLRVDTGTWDAGVVLATQWLRDGSPVAGATGRAYRLGRRDIGERISVRVTGTRPGYTPVVRVSGPTAPVTGKTFPASARVAVRGDAVVGRTLVADLRGWGSGIRVVHTWRAGGEQVGLKPRLRLTRAMIGQRITLTVTVAKPDFATRTVTTRPTAPVRPRR